MTSALSPVSAYTTSAWFPSEAFRVSQGQDLQRALDQHKIVRLSGGHFSSVVIRSGQRLIGVPGQTRVDRVEIEPGAEDFLLKGVRMDGGLRLPRSDSTTRRGTVAHIEGEVIADGATLEDITFWSCWHSQMSFFDTRMSRCTIIRPQSHGAGTYNDAAALTLIGRGTGNRGNAVLAMNGMEARNGALFIANLEDFALVGLDEESSEHKKGQPSITVRNVRRFSALGVGGWPRKADSIDTNASENLVVIHRMAADAPRRPIVLGGGAKLVAVASPEIAKQGNVIDQPKVPADWPPVLVRDDPQLRPIVRYPTRAERDDTDALQRKLDAGGCVELEPRVYGISRPLRIRREINLIGVAGKTAIVASGDHDILQTGFGVPGRDTKLVTFNMVDVAFVGGKTALHFRERGLMVTGFTFANLVFQGQSEAGIFVDHCYSLDNGSCDSIDFSGCETGVKQRAPDGPGDRPDLSYIDKLVFRGCQFVGCGRPIDLRPNRGNYLTGFIDCFIQGNRQPAHVNANCEHAYFINCAVDQSGGIAIESESDRTIFSRVRFIGQAKSLRPGLVSENTF